MINNIKNRVELLLALLYAGENTNVFDSNQRSTTVEGITRLEKLLFLLKIEEKFLSNAKPENDFKFVPFRMGPWTEEIYDELDFLDSLGLIERRGTKEASPVDEAHDDKLFGEMILDKYQKKSSYGSEGKEVYSLSKKGREKALSIWNRLPELEKRRIILVKRNYNKINLKQLLRYIYKKYPEYTSESEIKDEILGDSYN